MRILFIIMSLIISGQANSAPLESLDAFTWSNRLILVYSGPEQAQRFRAQLQEADDEIVDRHIIWFLIGEQQLLTNYRGDLSDSLKHRLIADWFPDENKKPEIVLIGKDGYEKLRERRLDLGIIFGLIDTMPMRRQEMLIR